MSDSEALYVQGFNSGYLIAKYRPELSAKLVKNVSSPNSFYEGLLSGSKEYALENTRTQLSDIARLRDQARGQEKDLDRDI